MPYLASVIRLRGVPVWQQALRRPRHAPGQPQIRGPRPGPGDRGDYDYVQNIHLIQAHYQTRTN